jgi:hypothetical protein
MTFIAGLWVGLFLGSCAGILVIGLGRMGREPAEKEASAPADILHDRTFAA